MIEPVIIGDARLLKGDAIALMNAEPAQSVDLVFGSPPYEDARTYGIDFRLKGQAWVDWMVQVVQASLRVSKGLVAFVVEGRTRNFRWSGTPVLLQADLIRAGVCLRKPPLYVRDGIPGSGGPDWLKNKYESIVCATRGGRLPWSDNTTMGMPTKYDEGGASSNRRADGSRVGYVPRHTRALVGTHRAERQAGRKYAKPSGGIANPGNLIDCGPGGGGHMGDELCHGNEAPFPEKLAEFFVRSFCPPRGTILDPFSGSGTTAAVALRWGRKAIAIDIRESQIELTKRRIAHVKADLPLLAGKEK